MERRIDLAEISDGKLYGAEDMVKADCGDCEGCSACQLVGDSTWRVAYIEYSSKPKRYRICQADEKLGNFHSPVTMEGVKHPQHGSFMRLTEEEYKRLQEWSDSIMRERAARNSGEKK